MKDIKKIPKIVLKNKKIKFPKEVKTPQLKEDWWMKREEDKWALNGSSPV